MQSHRSHIVTLFFAMLLAGIGQAAAEVTRLEISDRRIFGRFRMGAFVILEGAGGIYTDQDVFKLVS